MTIDTQARFRLGMLIVEDDRATSEILQRMITLKFTDFDIHVAATGEVGMELFREFRPDVVITDINLPMMDGIQMVAEMKAFKADTCFIVLTGYDLTTHVGRIREIGISEYILKPIEFRKLFSAIEACLASSAGAGPPLPGR